MMELLQKPLRTTLIIIGVLAAICLLVALSFFVWTKHLILKETVVQNDVLLTEQEPFPVSVQVIQHKIVEDPTVDWYVETYLSFNSDNSRQTQWLDMLLQNWCLICYMSDFQMKFCLATHQKLKPKCHLKTP